MLRVRSSVSRAVHNLDGVWSFCVDSHNSGFVWYQRRVTAPRLLDGERLILGFAAATRAAIVRVGDVEEARHVGGYLPFEADITDDVTAVAPGAKGAVAERLRPARCPGGTANRSREGSTFRHGRERQPARSGIAPGSGTMRVGGNKKGMSERNRAPKAVAYHIRQRWLALREAQGC